GSILAIGSAHKTSAASNGIIRPSNVPWDFHSFRTIFRSFSRQRHRAILALQMHPADPSIDAVEGDHVDFSCQRFPAEFSELQYCAIKFEGLAIPTEWLRKADQLIRCVEEIVKTA